MASPEELKDITTQFKRNTEDLQAYLRDLDQWQDEMQVKDDQLRAKAQSKTEKASQIAKKEKKAQNSEEKKRKVKFEPKTLKNPKEQKISGYDYAKWDKFDVDKALEDSDSEKELSEDENEPLAEEQLKQKAVMLKDKGNEYFKAGKYDQAINHYTQGIQCDPTNPMLPANRAMALIKKQQYGAAEKDCSVALDLDRTYVKAWMRRGTARFKLGKLQLAKEDFQQVCQLEPDNKQGNMELEKVRVAMEVPDEKPVKNEKKESFADNIKSAFASKKKEKERKVGQILPVKKDAHKRSREPLKRLEIHEVDSKDDLDRIFGGDEASLDQEIKLKSSRIQELESTATDDDHEVGKDVQGSKHEGLQLKEEQEILKEEKVEEAVVTNKKKLLTKPKNFVQFSKCWKNLSTDQKQNYLDLLAPNDYAGVFRHSLEPKLFSEIIQLLKSFCEKNPPNCLKHLVGLTKVPRISAFVIFMEEKDKEAIKHIVFQAEQSKTSSKDLVIVRSCFL